MAFHFCRRTVQLKMRRLLVALCVFSLLFHVTICDDDSSEEKKSEGEMKELKKNVSSLWAHVRKMRHDMEEDIHKVQLHQREVADKLKSIFGVEFEHVSEEHQHPPESGHDHDDSHSHGHHDEHHDQHHDRHQGHHDHHDDGHHGHHDGSHGHHEGHHDHHDDRHHDHHDDRHHDHRDHHDEHHHHHDAEHSEHHGEHHDQHSGHHDDHSHDHDHDHHHDNESDSSHSHPGHHDHHGNESDSSHSHPGHRDHHESDSSHSHPGHHDHHDNESDFSHSHPGHHDKEPPSHHGDQDHSHHDQHEHDIHEHKSEHTSEAESSHSDHGDHSSHTSNETHSVDSHRHHGIHRHHQHDQYSHHHQHSSRMDPSKYIFAVCMVQQNIGVEEEKRQNLTGMIRLWQKKNGTTLHIHIKVKGFKVDGDHSEHSKHLHGFHVHEKGDLSNGCQSTGPHYNVENVDHGGPTSPIRHTGDLGNIECDERGITNVVLTDEVASLEGEHSIIGRSLVIHERKDDLGIHKDNEASRTTGDAGGRIACCIIESVDRLPAVYGHRHGHRQHHDDHHAHHH